MERAKLFYFFSICFNASVAAGIHQPVLRLPVHLRNVVENVRPGSVRIHGLTFQQVTISLLRSKCAIGLPTQRSGQAVWLAQCLKAEFQKCF